MIDPKENRISNIETLIDQNADRHKEADDDDDFIWESLENEVMRAILEYCRDFDLAVPGYDLSETLENDDPDEIESVIVFMNDNAAKIEATASELVEYYFQKFWPDEDV